MTAQIYPDLSGTPGRTHFMNLQEIRLIARAQGLKPGKQDKTSMIKNIQIAEGNFDCFATATSGICDQINCIWRDDCLAIATSKLVRN